MFMYTEPTQALHMNSVSSKPYFEELRDFESAESLAELEWI